MKNHRENLYDDIVRTYNNKKCWGLMAAIDIRKCNIKPTMMMEDFMDKLCELIKMKKYGNLQIHRSDDHYTAYQLIETSLISCHFRYNGTSHIDIFSCKIFNPYDALDFIMNYFETDDGNVNLIYRN